MIIEKDCSNWKFSSNINYVIRAVLNFLLFFYKEIFAQKSTKGTKITKTHQKAQKAPKHKNATKHKHKIANKQTKIKSTLKKYRRGKK